MISMRSRSKKAKVLPSVLIGNAIALTFCLCASLLCPIFVLNGTLEGVYFKISVGVVHGIAAFTGVAISCLIVEEKKWITAMLCWVALMAFLVICAMLFFVADGGSIIWGLLSSAVGMICALLILLKKKRPRKSIRKSSRSR